jgi:hypothetical protein
MSVGNFEIQLSVCGLFSKKKNGTSEASLLFVSNSLLSPATSTVEQAPFFSLCGSSSCDRSFVS